jgi:hypothetical protein
MEIPPPSQPQSDRSGFAIASLIVGIINLCAWIIPLCGCPTAIIGIVLGILGLQSSKKTLAIVGLILCGLGLLATIVNGVLGVVLNTSDIQNMLRQ